MYVPMCVDRLGSSRSMYVPGLVVVVVLLGGWRKRGRLGLADARLASLERARKQEAKGGRRVRPIQALLPTPHHTESDKGPLDMVMMVMIIINSLVVFVCVCPGRC